MRVLITGGTGTFGHAIVKHLLCTTAPDRVIVYSRDEQKQQVMQQTFPDGRLVTFIGDVRDRDRLTMAMHNVDVVIHAAALKIVPKGEWDPSEFMKTNVLGSDNVIHGALYAGVRKVVLLSTDKAVSPINLYGATKLCAEKLFIAANNYRSADGPIFSVVRYGNVAGSRGSVIPFFREVAARRDPLPITHPEMTRFWITSQEAAAFVIEAIEHMQGGEVFIPRMPSFRITDLAAAIVPRGLSILTGVRPGEKIHEDLITMHEALNAYEHGNAYVIVPPWMRPPAAPEFGQITSGLNSRWLTVDMLREKLADV